MICVAPGSALVWTCAAEDAATRLAKKRRTSDFFIVTGIIEVNLRSPACLIDT